MKLKRILSSVLTVALLLPIISVLIPASVSATYIAGGAETLTTDQKAEIVSSALKQTYDNAADALNADLEAGYLDSVTLGDFTLYVNRYTGMAYYKNNLTQQILTSNPVNVATSGTTTIDTANKNLLSSQIVIDYYETAVTTNKGTMNSTQHAASKGQITTSFINNGIRVNYVIGEANVNFLAPGAIFVERFEQLILFPMVTPYVELVSEYMNEFKQSEEYQNLSDRNKSEIDNFEFDFFKTNDFYLNEEYEGNALGAARAYYNAAKRITDKYLDRDKRDELSNLWFPVGKILSSYTLQDPKLLEVFPNYEELLESLYEKYPIIKETGQPIYTLNEGQSISNMRSLSNVIITYCPEYSYSDKFQDENDTGYVSSNLQTPLFKCALEYTLNSDGTLSVTLPANSITFDEEYYSLQSITPVPYFGAGDMRNYGYLFYPDGSGSILEFEDYYNDYTKTNIYRSADVYGYDNSLSTITAQHHGEQIVMPVYGIINDTKVNGNMTRTGFFAIIEEGDGMAKLTYSAGGVSHQYIGLYATFNMRPTDTFDLSNTISVSGIGVNSLAAEGRYTGNFTLRYSMLADPLLAGYNPDRDYAASYVGMATCYRDYLKENGVLTALENVGDNISLYIESFGSIEIMSKILTFPVNVDIALTTFSDISAMYDELAENGITNVNFKLTGFANGGMDHTYPTKLKWMKACGGKGDFEDLIAYSAEKGFGVYPDFDFMYLTNTAMFDGISRKQNCSRMMDNRYASKQTYFSVYQMFGGHFENVVSADSLAELFAKFDKKYSKYSHNYLSLSGIAADLNSNFDSDNIITRQDAMGYITSLLSSVSSRADGKYSVMMDMGNIYAAGFASHILELPTDSSHYKYYSYTIPFTGMVLHGYVNYAGSPLNESGSPDYNFLRSLENGAALYYILSYQNTEHLKESAYNEYYSVNYENWKEDLIAQYKKLNDAIGSLGSYNIVDHAVLIAERVIDETEREENLIALETEFLDILLSQVNAKIYAAYEQIKNDPAAYGKGVRVEIDKDAIVAQMSDILGEDVSDNFSAELDSLINELYGEYNNADDVDPIVVSVNAVDDYENNTQLHYVTDSSALDDDYSYTDFSLDDGSIVMVTYSNGTDSVRFILNYNIFSVTVRLNGQEYEIPKYGYVKI